MLKPSSRRMELPYFNFVQQHTMSVLTTMIYIIYRIFAASYGASHQLRVPCYPWLDDAVSAKRHGPLVQCCTSHRYPWKLNCHRCRLDISKNLEGCLLLICGAQPCPDLLRGPVNGQTVEDSEQTSPARSRHWQRLKSGE